MRKVIVNSTPLIVLCGIGKLNILKELYKEIVIPSAVYTEVTAKADSACIQLQLAGDWIRVEQIKDHGEKKMYKASEDLDFETAAKLRDLIFELKAKK